MGFRKNFECVFLIINHLLSESSNTSCITLQQHWGIGNCNTDFAGVFVPGGAVGAMAPPDFSRSVKVYIL